MGVYVKYIAQVQNAFLYLLLITRIFSYTATTFNI